MDIALQIELVIRLVGAAILGAAIGLEREHHGHPAGTRTHLLVALGSAVFTVLSIYGFPSADGAPTDPSRVAAQIVTGIGFLGAGAIIKYGTSIRGLTTAASLWCAAAVGMAAGAGWWILAIACAVIVLVSLGPVAWLTRRTGLAERSARISLTLADLDALGGVTRELAQRQIEILDIDVESASSGYEAELRLRLPTELHGSDLTASLKALDGVEITSIANLAD